MSSSEVTHVVLETTLSSNTDSGLSVQVTTRLKYYSKSPPSAVPEGCIVINYTDSWDSPDDPISQNSEKIFGLAITGVLIPILVVVSVPTNIINMAVFYKQGLKERINLCLFWRSFVDCVNIIQIYLLHADTMHVAFRTLERHGVILQFYSRNRLLFLTGLCWVSASNTTIIAWERCFCVVSPFHSRRFLKNKTMIIIFGVLLVVILGLDYIAVLQWSVTCMYDPVTNTTSTIMYPSKEYLENMDLVETLQGTVFGTIIPGFCITTVTVTTIITSVYLRKMGTWRRSSNPKSAVMTARDMSLTRTLVALSVLFIVCHSAAFLTLNARRAFPEIRLGGRLHNTMKFLTTCGVLATYVNTSFHFFVYYSSGSKYRETFRELFHCCSNQKPTKSCG